MRRTKIVGAQTFCFSSIFPRGYQTPGTGLWRFEQQKLVNLTIEGILNGRSTSQSQTISVYLMITGSRLDSLWERWYQLSSAPRQDTIIFTGINSTKAINYGEWTNSFWVGQDVKTSSSIGGNANFLNRPQSQPWMIWLTGFIGKQPIIYKLKR